MNLDTFNPFSRSEAKGEEEKKKTGLASRTEKLIPLGFRSRLRGADKLRELPPDKHVVFLCTHMSDFDVPLTVGTIAPERGKLKVAEASTHDNFFQSPGGYLGRKVAGKENSFSIKFTGGEGDGAGIFDPEDYEEMKEALLEGNDMVVAAYYDIDYQGHTWRVPQKGGYGGVYLASSTPDTLIVPVAVDIKSREPFGLGRDVRVMNMIKEMRPEVEVIIGDAFEPEKIEGIDRFAEIMKKWKTDLPVTDEERQILKEVQPALRRLSDSVMARIAEMLPPEKRPGAGQR